jgi:hypothetical protein
MGNRPIDVNLAKLLRFEHPPNYQDATIIISLKNDSALSCGWLGGGPEIAIRGVSNMA